jgi:tetratricopeptide (TPR) repeat protein
VQKFGDKLGINAQLIRAATDQHLWADQYERDLRDVLSLQREVARAIAGEINVKLTPSEQGLLANARPVNPEALDAYLKGCDYFNRGINFVGPQQGTDYLKTSVEHFEWAIGIDPNFGLAYAAMGDACNWLGSSRDLLEFAPRAKEAATRALAIDETLAQAHHVLAYNLMVFDWNWGESEREYKRAIDLNPSYSRAHESYAIYLMFVGRFDQMFRETNLAQELDPLTIPFKLNEAERYTWARQYDRAIEQFRRLLETQPNNALIHRNLGYAYMYKGMYEEGIAKLRKAGELSGRDASRDLDLAWVYAMSRNRSQAIKILDECLKQLSMGWREEKLGIALIYTALGDRDKAFEYLEKAYQEHSEGLLTLKSYPGFDNLRSDSRYQDLIRRIGFPQ